MFSVPHNKETYPMLPLLPLPAVSVHIREDSASRDFRELAKKRREDTLMGLIVTVGSATELARLLVPQSPSVHSCPRPGASPGWKPVTID